MKDFTVTLKDWKIVKDGRNLPSKDNTIHCIYSFNDGTYEYARGDYWKEKGVFRAEIYGIGAVVEKKNIVAWMPVVGENVSIVPEERKID